MMNTYPQKVLRCDINDDYMNIPITVITEDLALKYEVGNNENSPNLLWFTLTWKLHYVNPNNNDEVFGLLVSQVHEISKEEVSLSVLAAAVSLSTLSLRQKVENVVSQHILFFSQLHAVDILLNSKGILKALLAIN